MSDDKIAKIRARHNAVLREKVHKRYYSDAHNDRAALLAEVERLRAEKEALYASIMGIERAAAGAIYSQESIHAMALYALKSLEVKP